MNSITVRAYAKVNLSLDITGSRDGYHTIDSVVASVGLCDEIRAVRRGDGRVNVVMRGGCEDIPPEHNNAVKAARGYVEAFATSGADIEVVKRIPVGAGLGGSSADVAGVLNAMSVLYGGDYAAVKAVADSIGSDCGYMLRGGFARISGRGDRVSPVATDLKLHLLLVLPPQGVSTAGCYALSDAYPERRHTSEAVSKAICAGQLHELGRALSNGLYPAAVLLNGDVRSATEELLSLAPLGVNMTGSGSGVFALFADARSRDDALKNYGGEFRAIAVDTVIPERYV